MCMLLSQSVAAAPVLLVLKFRLRPRRRHMHFMCWALVI